MKTLPHVTLVAITSVNIPETLSALRRSLEQVRPARTILFTHLPVEAEGIECVRIPPISWEGYSEFVLKQLYRYVETSHVLIVQHDGWVLDAGQWSDEFLHYDYIGALWPYTDGRANGNGGFSLRSYRLLEATALDRFLSVTHPEDECVCRLYRGYLEQKYGLVWAPDYLCQRFSFELVAPTAPTFGFHSDHHEPYRPFVVVRRSGAMGDVVMCEPVLRYFHEQGYRVALDTAHTFMDLFRQHDFPVYHVSELPSGLTPERYIDLDGVYEHRPTLPVLMAYYQAAGIRGVLKKALLRFPVDETTKIFKKYCVLHIDRTGMEHRNMRGVSWKEVRAHLETRGYTVIQVGKGLSEYCGLHYNARSLQHLMYLIAGADLFVGIDSGPGQLAQALGVPSLLLFGSVNPNLRYWATGNLQVLSGDCPLHKRCYHEVVDSPVGKTCEITPEAPPCTVISAQQVCSAIDLLLKKIKR